VVNRYRWGLWAPTSGLASAAFFVLAFAFSTEVGGESRDLSEFYSDSGNRAQVQTAFFCFAAAFLLLVWFVWTLRNRLMAAEGAPGNLSSLAFTAGMVSVPLWFVASSAFAAPAFDYKAGEFNVEAAQLLGWAGYGAFVGAQMVFAFTVVVVAVLTFRTRTFPIWFGWASLIIGLILLFAIAFLPFFFFLAWLAATSALMLWESWNAQKGVRPTAAA
jgi:hypothetical protein